VSAALRLCEEADATVSPWGGGTAMALGNPPRQVDGRAQYWQTRSRDRPRHRQSHGDGKKRGSVWLRWQQLLADQRQFVPSTRRFLSAPTVGGSLPPISTDRGAS